MSLVDPHRMRRALELFHEGPDGTHMLITTYECLHVEAQRRTSLEPGDVALSELTRVLQYSVFRIGEVFSRLDLINWMQAIFRDKKGEEAHPWHTYAALAIKDFHVDVSALMDSVAPVLIQATVGIKQATVAIKKEDRKKLPGFPDIQAGTKRTYRGNMPSKVVALVDNTDRWWRLIKENRDTLAHRQHDRIIFGRASKGVLFQLYAPALCGRKRSWTQRFCGRKARTSPTFAFTRLSS